LRQDRKSRVITPHASTKQEDHRRSNIALLVSVLSLLVSAGGLWFSILKQIQIEEREERHYQQMGFLLGKRLAVWESNQGAMYNIWKMAPTEVRPPDSLKYIGLEEIKSAAEPLGIKLDYVESGKELPTALPDLLTRQVEDAQSTEIAAAFRLGRAVGAYDPGAIFVGEVKFGQKVVPTHEELSSNTDYRAWVANINRDLKAASIPMTVLTVTPSTPYLVAAQGRFLLGVFIEWFANPAAKVPKLVRNDDWKEWSFVIAFPAEHSERFGVPQMNVEALNADSVLSSGSVRIPPFASAADARKY
jgi:hypothetical protein